MFCVRASVTVAKLDVGGLEEDAKLETFNGVGPPEVVVPDSTCREYKPIVLTEYILF